MRILPGASESPALWLENHQGHLPPHADFVPPSQTTMTLPCFLDTAFESVPFFLPLFKTLSRYILADPRELEGRMRDFVEEGLP